MKRPEPGRSNPVGGNMEVDLKNWFYSQLESVGIHLDLSLGVVEILAWAFESIEAQIHSSRRYLAQQLGFRLKLDLELPIYPDPSSSFDPADILITRYLKHWIDEEDIPSRVRAQVLESATQPSITSNWIFILRMTLKWVLSSGLGLISILISNESLIFIPSSDNYCLNPPHMSPCIIHTRVRDTFLLEAGLYGVIG
jgi:hypothetical protein